MPALITRRLRANPTPITAPTSERFPAVVLFADISGFTALTEYLAQQGPAGAETLTHELNRYFGQLIDLITSYGGDVVKFAGDALTAVWPAVSHLASPSIGEREGELSIVARQASACALAIQTALKDYQTAGGLKLALRIGLGTGNLAMNHVGGVYGRWEFVITGPPLQQVSQAEVQAQPGQVILSPEAWELVQTYCEGQELAEGYVRLEMAPDEKKGLEGSRVSLNSPQGLPLSHELETALRAYLPGAILARLTAGHSGWLAELRRVTVLFINLPDLTYITPLEQGQAAMQALQMALYRYEGSVNKISVDDKGATLVAALGLPPLAHEDDATRGVQAALAMQAALRELGWRCAIGVTTGRAFCGSVGNTTRREYTMMGDVINLAARLMQAAGVVIHPQVTGEGEVILPILCDETTFQAAQSQIVLEALSPMKVKGKAQLIPIYRPTTKSSPPKSKIGDLHPSGVQSKTEMVGRTAERMLLSDNLQKLQRGHSSVVIIEGEAGIGKSRLVEELLRQAQALKVDYLIGAGDAIEKSTPYHAWRSVFQQLFGLETTLESVDAPLHQAAERLRQSQRTHILNQLEKNVPDLVPLAPLLNTILPLDLPDNDLTSRITGEARAHKTHELLLSLLKQRYLKGAENPSGIILIVEDAHWLDSSSWAFLRPVSLNIQPLLLVIATRPLADPLPPEYSQLSRAATSHLLKLESLSSEETLTLVCQRLGVAALPELVAALIRQKAEGHPFFSEELAYALRDGGLLEISQGQCRLSLQAGNLNDLNFPDSLQGVITSRIDRLTPPQQLTLKVASVIGRTFAFRPIRDIYPIAADKPHLFDYLKVLEQLHLTRLETPEPNLAYIFKHIITQEVTYHLMAFAQRRQLHRAVVDWYEKTFGEVGRGVDEETTPSLAQSLLSSYIPLLAHHAHYAEDYERERYYARVAGEQMAAQFANQEAVIYLSRALDLTPEEAWHERYDLLLAREKVYDLQGEREAQAKDLITMKELAEAQADDRRRAQVALRQAHYAEATGDYPAAIMAAQAVVSLAQISQTNSLEAMGYLQWGRALRYQDNYEAARVQLGQALALAQDKQLLKIEAESLRNLGVVSDYLGDPARATAHLEQALRLFRQSGDREGEGHTLNNLGVIYSNLGNYAKSTAYYQQALLIHREIGDRRNEGYVLSNLGGNLAEEQGDFAGAKACYEQSLRIRQEIGDREGEGIAIGNLGFQAAIQGDYASAIDYYEQDLLISREIGNRQGQSMTLSNLGLLWHQLGDNQRSHEYSQQALLIAQDLGHRHHQGYALMSLGHALASLGHLTEAADIYQQALTLRRELGEYNLAMEALAGLARISLAQNNLPQAHAQVEEILSYLESQSLAGTDEPFRVYLTCYHVLQANQDPRAPTILNIAHRLLQEQAAKISDERLRHTYLENVPAHREIVSEFDSLSTGLS